MALLEFGGNKQKQDIRNIFSNYNITFYNDLNNEPRIVKIINV